eukprot:COSAG02_NODE_518_length_20798_cov_12.622301_2_plen_148_part_00
MQYTTTIIMGIYWRAAPCFHGVKSHVVGGRPSSRPKARNLVKCRSKMGRDCHETALPTGLQAVRGARGPTTPTDTAAATAGCSYLKVLLQPRKGGCVSGLKRKFLVLRGPNRPKRLENGRCQAYRGHCGDGYGLSEAPSCHTSHPRA